MSKEKQIQEYEKRQLLDELSKMPPMVISTAYLHAINYTLYGENVTEKWLTATQQASALEKAYRDGYYDALQKQPCEDCISREEVRRILGNEVFELMKLHTVNPEDNPKADAMAHGVNWSLNTLMELPSVTPQRPKGKWIHWTDDYKDYCTCSECDYGEEGEVLLKDKTPYCPVCGAEMSGGREDAT